MYLVVAFLKSAFTEIVSVQLFWRKGEAIGFKHAHIVEILLLKYITKCNTLSLIPNLIAKMHITLPYDFYFFEQPRTFPTTP